jgi:Glycosyl hydrolase 36 superfamily, catalytic domain/Glycosyltransferase family 36
MKRGRAGCRTIAGVRGLAVGVVVLLLLGCAPDEVLDPVREPAYVPPAERCEPVELDAPDRFSYCNEGSGIFGEWQLDDGGLPVYFYGLDQNSDARASYPVTEGLDGEPLDPRSHWAAVGNRRLNIMASNDGHVQVVTQDRGVSYLNVFDEAQRRYAGGFSYLDDGERSWCTAYKWRPFGAATSRRFGMGYVQAEMIHRDIRIERIVGAPPGDVPALLSEVTIENISDETKSLTHYEVWDVGRRPIEINWLVSGKVFTSAPATARELRDERNAMFAEQVSYQTNLLSVRRDYVGDEPRPDRAEANATDFYPVDPFLAALDAPVHDVWVEDEAFFGSGGIAAPAAVTQRLAGAGTAGGVLGSASAIDQPHVLVMKTELQLEPGQQRRLRFAYGYARSGEAFEPVLADVDVDDLRAAHADHLAERLFLFATERDPALHREMAWHSYQLEASVGYRDYWQGAVVPQGSAYLYLHGADGAARDLGLFAVPLSYSDPPLAKQELRLYMGIQRQSDGAFSYAFQGHGMVDDAAIHSAPSDLPLFFAWALAEYVSATGDLAFLDERVPWHPRVNDATVYVHLVAALRYLFDVVATGEHGLIRVQTGDWSDGIVVAAPDRELAIENGESVPNTQMAVAVLGRVADLIEPRDPALASEVRGHVAKYRAALADQWTGEHFVRAYYGDGVPVDADRLNLESQVWALIGDSFEAVDQRQQLVDAIGEQLDTPLGATLWPGGEVWPAISALYTEGIAQSHPELAWDHLSRNTLRAHAVTFPQIWYGIWSGPDGIDADSGWSWASEVTPMRDYAVQNNNAHAMPLLAALRVAGVGADAGGVVVAPGSREPFALRTRLLDVTLQPGRLHGVYRPNGDRILTLSAPPGTSVLELLRNGAAVLPTAPAILDAPGDSATSFELTFE